METWQTVLLAIGGNATLLLVLGILAKSFLDKLIARDSKELETKLLQSTEEFKNTLHKQTQTELDRLRDEMNRNMESYKIKLKKSEVFFQRELDAASAFSTFLHSILPRYTDPDIDWYLVCDEIAKNFEKIENQLSIFMERHAVILSDEERTILSDAISDAGLGKFDIVHGDVEPVTNQQADKMYKKLQTLETKLISRIRLQASL